MATVLLIGTLDTKGPEIAYLRDRIRALGSDALTLDSGILGEAIGIEPDFNRRDTARAAGSDLETIRNAGSRGKAVEQMLQGVRAIAQRLAAEKQIHGIASLGGAEGAVLAAAAMKVLPVGLPKLIVCPLASGHRKFGPFIGTKDIMVMHSVVDILGVNDISRMIYDNAAAAISGMAQSYEASLLRSFASKPCKAIAVTMLGNTTRPIQHILKPGLEKAGYDVVIFHANGVGGPAMEELITQNFFAGVLDYTLSEVAGQIAGGFHVGGPSRMEAAGKAGLPQVVVPGCLDFVAVGAKHEIPEKFRDRPTYYHNPEFTLCRLTFEEQLAAARFVIEKVNAAKGTVSLVFPLRGGSIMENQNGGVFWDAALTAACREEFRKGLSPCVAYREVDAHINDDAFANIVLEEVLRVMEEKKRR